MTGYARAVLVRRPFALDQGPLSLAQRLVERPGAFLLADEERGRVYLGCEPCASSREVDPEPGLALDPALADVPRWVGLLPYEAFRQERVSAVARERRAAPHLETPWWYRYGAVLVASSTAAGWSGELVGDDVGALERLAAALRSPACGAAPAVLSLREPIEAPAPHIERIRAALEAIGRGELYQVNLARRFTFDASGHPLTLLQALGPAAQAPFAAALSFDTDPGPHAATPLAGSASLGVVSASPELFLELSAEGRLVTRPIKGTRPRGRDELEDQALRAALDHSDKERAELAMVIDVERNDLGRLAETGSVSVTAMPHVVTHPTVHHREATVVAQLRAGTPRDAVLRQMMPSGSVTGAPKVRAMELIANLEASRRGLYTGALGALNHDGSLRLSMAIRVLTLQGGEAHYYAGGGIVADSDPTLEVEETLWKARQLRALAPRLG